MKINNNSIYKDLFLANKIDLNNFSIDELEKLYLSVDRDTLPVFSDANKIAYIFEFKYGIIDFNLINPEWVDGGVNDSFLSHLFHDKFDKKTKMVTYLGQDWIQTEKYMPYKYTNIEYILYNIISASYLVIPCIQHVRILIAFKNPEITYKYIPGEIHTNTETTKYYALVGCVLIMNELSMVESIGVTDTKSEELMPIHVSNYRYSGFNLILTKGLLADFLMTKRLYVDLKLVRYIMYGTRPYTIMTVNIIQENHYDLLYYEDRLAKMPSTDENAGMIYILNIEVDGKIYNMIKFHKRSWSSRNITYKCIHHILA